MGSHRMLLAAPSDIAASDRASPYRGNSAVRCGTAHIEVFTSRGTLLPGLERTRRDSAPPVIATICRRRSRGATRRRSGRLAKRGPIVLRPASHRAQLVSSLNPDAVEGAAVRGEFATDHLLNCHAGSGVAPGRSCPGGDWIATHIAVSTARRSSWMTSPCRSPSVPRRPSRVHGCSASSRTPTGPDRLGCFSIDTWCRRRCSHRSCDSRSC